jgi:hypothetical protein
MSGSNPHSTGYGPSSRRRIHFDGNADGYQTWESRFLAYLYTQDKGLKKAILPLPEGVDEDEDHEDRNQMAYAELVQVLDERSLQLIIKDADGNGREALSILRKHYASTETPRVLTLYEELTTLRKRPDEEITDYIIRAERAATGLNSAGEQISDNLIIAMLLKGLPEEYKPFVVVHMQLDKQKTLIEFKAALHNYANTENLKSSTNQVMTASRKQQYSKHSQKCLSCGKGGHNSSACRIKSKLNCTYCHKPGHIESVCLKKSRGATDKTANSAHSANASKTNYSFSIKSEQAYATNPTNLKDQLIVDCGATCHIVNDSAKFIDYDKSFDSTKHYIELADGRRSNEIATARGTARFTVVDSNGEQKEFLLNGALLAPSIPVSLFSVRAATDSGAHICFTKGAATLTASDNTSFNIEKVRQLYFLPTPSRLDQTYTARTLDDWHKTLGHMNHYDILQLQLVTNGMTVTEQTKQSPCVTCIENKQSRTPKYQDELKIYASKPLQRVHTDLCGPIEPCSQDGYRYMINFIDEYSSMLFVYFLRSKDQAHNALKMFLADTAPIGQVKEIHSDNGTEYTNKTFQQILLDNKIKFTTTAPYSPFQNGKSERSWRSLLDMARCLLADASLPKHLWTYATKHACYLRNRSYQRRTKATAYELFTGIKPDMRHLYTFGATCTIYQEGPKQKLEPRGQEGIYLGVNPRSQGYYILQRNQRITTSRNVKVHEYSLVEDDDDNTNRKQEQKPLQEPEKKEEQTTPITAPSEDTATEVSHTSQGGATETAEDNTRKSTRERKPPARMEDYIWLTDTDYAFMACVPDVPIPTTYEEAINSDEAAQWKAAMDTEIASLTGNNTWELATLPPNRTETKGKWVFTIKQGKSPDEKKYKARYVAKGYSQQPGIDFDETFSPTTRFTSVRVLLQLAVNNGYHVHQMDVKGAYLNAPIDKEIYLEQPPGYRQESDDETHLTCRLNKSIYGLKQSGRNWYSTLTNFLKTHDFKPNPADPCTYTSGETTDDLMMIIFWVDDIILACKDIKRITEVKAALNHEFNMDDRGELSWYLGIEFRRLKDGSIFMSQQKYINNILQRFNMKDCKPVKTPAQIGLQLTQSINDDHTLTAENSFPYREVIGSLIYLMMATRPDISWIVSRLSQYLERPQQMHITAAKRVLRYLNGSQSTGIIFSKTNDWNLRGYSDSDWANDQDDRRSTTGYIFTLGSGPISWKTRKQPSVALSSCEAEYMALAEATKEALHLRNYCMHIISELQLITIYCDSQAAISLTKDNAKHSRTKHIDVRYHFIKEQKEIQYVYTPTEENLADYLTKPLGYDKHRFSNQQLQIEGAC